MENPRIENLKRMLQSRPQDQRARFGLALEYEKLGAWEEVVALLQDYLADADDEGNAYGRLAQALRQLGRTEEARDAYRTGIAAALRHGHPTMAAEFEEELENID